VTCSQCGAENAAGAKFCRSCGSALFAADLPTVGGDPVVGISPEPLSPNKPPRDLRTMLLLGALVLATVAVGGALFIALGSGDSAKKCDPTAADCRAGGTIVSRDTAVPTTTPKDGSGAPRPGTSGPARTTPITPTTTLLPPGVTTSPVVDLVPGSIASTKMVAAPGMDDCKPPNTTPFDAGLAMDGNLNTAWEIAEPSAGAQLVLRFDRPVLVTSISLVPGYAKTDPCEHWQRWYQIRRISAVDYEFDRGSPIRQIFADTPALQPSPPFNRYTRIVRVRIGASLPPGGPKFLGDPSSPAWEPELVLEKVAISEIRVRGVVQP
jgi:hypothetical protein